MNSFNKEMNILRGIAIFLVVVGHASFKENFANHISNTAFLQWLVDFIYTFHMPLFFFVSGFFGKKAFAIKSKDEYFSFMKKKTFKIMIPYLTFSLAGLIIKLVLAKYANSPVNLKTVFIDILINPWENPIKLLWFIYTLYLIFALIPFLNKVGNKIKVVILGILWCLPIYYSLLFNLNGIVRYSLFFILGYEFYKKYDKYIASKKNMVRPLLLFMVLIAINIKPVETGVFVNVFELICSLLAILSLLDFVHIINLQGSVGKIFNFLGKYSFDIYLLHWFFQMPVKLLYEKLKFDYNVLFIIAFVTAFISIPFSKYIIKKVPLINFLAFGNNKIGKEQKVANQI